MFRPRGALARTVMDKIQIDKDLSAMDKSHWYQIREEEMGHISMEILNKFSPLHLDVATQEFLDKAVENSDNICWQIWLSLATSVLSWFMSPTSINGYLGRGSMHVFSKAQFRSLIGWDDHVIRSLLDIGAGDGTTTNQMAPCFSHVYVTEISKPMKQVLTTKGFSVLDENCWDESEERFSVISCLNVLDRCDEPRILLEKIKEKLEPDGIAVIAFVIPFNPYVEFESKTHVPKELLPIKGSSFEEEVGNFVVKVLEPKGWDLVRWTRLPYLCDGDIRQAFYWLDDALFVIRPKDS